MGLIAALALSVPAGAEEPRGQARPPLESADTPESPPDGAAEKEKRKDGLAFLPLLYYTPDTRFAFGAVGAYYFRLGEETEAEGPAPRLSYVKLLADYTQNKQLDVWGSWSVFIGREDYIYKGELRYRNFPDRFYGLGNDSQASDMERYSYDFASVKQFLLKRLAPGVFLGGDYQFTSFFRVQAFKPDGKLADGTITGSRGGNSSGLGAVLLLDTRDNVVAASRGHFLQLSTYLYQRWLGSDFSYFNVNLNAARYWQTWGDQVLAVHFVSNTNIGDPPLPALSAVGNDDILRGYATNRYRDRNFIGAQVEYRVPIWWRIGAVAFVGAGDVFGHLDDLSLARLKASGGVGLRFAYDQEERFNIRLDYAWGRFGESSFYLMFGEAF